MTEYNEKLIQEHIDRLRLIQEFVESNNIDDETALALYNKELEVYSENIIADFGRKLMGQRLQHTVHDTRPGEDGPEGVIITKNQAIEQLIDVIKAMISNINECITKNDPSKCKKLALSDIILDSQYMPAKMAYNSLDNALQTLSSKKIGYTVYTRLFAVKGVQQLERAIKNFDNTSKKLSTISAKDNNFSKLSNMAQSIHEKLQKVYDRLKGGVDKLVDEWKHQPTVIEPEDAVKIKANYKSRYFKGNTNGPVKDIFTDKSKNA